MSSGNEGNREPEGPMSAILTKIKNVSSTSAPPPPIESNPIMEYFEVGKESSTAGPELVWRVHDAYRKSDGKVSSSWHQNGINTMQFTL